MRNELEMSHGSFMRVLKRINWSDKFKIGREGGKHGLKLIFEWGKMKHFTLKLINILTQSKWSLFVSLMLGIIRVYDNPNEKQNPSYNLLPSFRSSYMILKNLS